MLLKQVAYDGNACRSSSNNHSPIFHLAFQLDILKRELIGQGEGWLNTWSGRAREYHCST